MTTYITRRELSPIQGGTRVIPHYEGYGLKTEVGKTSAMKDNTLLGNKGKMATTLLMGSRSRTINGYEAVGFLGSGISITNSDPNRVYQMIKEVGLGLRNMVMTADDLIIESRIAGTRVEKIRSGVGSFGIQYTQTVVQNDDKRIRRWPRDWHGDNMKN